MSDSNFIVLPEHAALLNDLLTEHKRKLEIELQSYDVYSAHDPVSIASMLDRIKYLGKVLNK